MFMSIYLHQKNKKNGNNFQNRCCFITNFVALVYNLSICCIWCRSNLVHNFVWQIMGKGCQIRMSLRGWYFKRWKMHLQKPLPLGDDISAHWYGSDRTNVFYPHPNLSMAFGNCLHCLRRLDQIYAEIPDSRVEKIHYTRIDRCRILHSCIRNIRFVLIFIESSG